MTTSVTKDELTPEQMAQRVIDWLQSPEGREEMRKANERTDEFVERLKRMRPTKETWDWTPTI